jgi:hypothetical protein
MSISPRLPALLSFLALVGSSWAEAAVTLREPFAAGYQYHVSSRVELAGSLSLPAEPGQTSGKSLAVKGHSAIEYDERILALGTSGQVEKSARIYRRMDFQRTVGAVPQQNMLRPAVRRLILLRHGHAEVPFSPDGPLLWGEIDLVRTDVFTPALTGLLGDRPVVTGDRWKATDDAVLELTDLERIEEGQIDCRFEGVSTLDNRRYARVALAGTVRGTNEDGPNRQQLEGYFFFDLTSNHLSYLYIKGTHVLLNKEGQAQGKVEGHFVLTRQAHVNCPDLSDQALKDVALEPNADNTLLLHDNPDLGLRFQYPRRWRVGSVRGRQVTLDESGGGGILITLESADKVPTGSQFLTESRDYLTSQKAKIVRTDAPKQMHGATGALEHFALEVEMGGTRSLMDYYVIRQGPTGATLAARLPANDNDKLRQEVERLTRSLTLSKALPPEVKK